MTDQGKPVKAFMLAVGKNKLLGFAERRGVMDRPTLGAYTPPYDGNYYDRICMGFQEKDEKTVPSFASWWEHIKQWLVSGYYHIDDEFPFDPDEVRIVEATIDMTQGLG